MGGADAKLLVAFVPSASGAQAAEVASGGHQALGMSIRTKGELLDYGFDARARSFVDHLRSIDHAGDGANRNLRSAANIFDRGWHGRLGGKVGPDAPRVLVDLSFVNMCLLDYDIFLLLCVVRRCVGPTLTFCAALSAVWL